MLPLLSIGVPTYNRAHLLFYFLRRLNQEYAGLSEKGQVEFIVSDNCSVDDTEAVVNGFQEDIPIRYHRNERNIGAPANILQLPKLAAAKYCWILGDDDLLVPGSLAHVLQLLQEHPNVPAIVVGYSYQQEEVRDLLQDDANPPKFDNPVYSTISKPFIIDRWENTFFETKTAALHTSIVSCIFQSEDWLSRVPRF
jgi:glycosyltransferase involved in cell wall biosynthesis